MIEQKLFRSDLFYRLNIIPIALPPLRSRDNDLILLAGTFLKKYAHELQKTVDCFSEKAMEAILNYAWPGNIRELQNAIQRAVALCDGTQVQVADLNLPEQFSLPSPVTAPVSPVSMATFTDESLFTNIPSEGMDLEKHLQDIEKRIIKNALAQTDGNQTEAAKLLGMSFRSIRYKVKKFNIK